MVNRPIKILIVEDEEAIRTGLTDVFTYHGYAVEGCVNGTEGLSKAVSGRFDLVLLDVMLPGMNGFDVCDSIRKVDRDLPVIMLTAKNSDEDIIEGLKIGADDYVSKPFSVAQLVARVEAVLRRARIETRQDVKIRLANDLTIDTENLKIEGSNQEILFTRREMEILQYLSLHHERPVPREELLTKVWGYARDLDIETRSVDIHMAKIRRKIEPDPKNPVHLTTVRGAGYRLLVV